MTVDVDKLEDRMARLLAAPGSDAEQAVQQQDRELVAALARLSETARAVVWLHDVEGYTHEEIAELMDRTVSFSKSQLSRAHMRLRDMLGEEVQC